MTTCLPTAAPVIVAVPGSFAANTTPVMYGQIQDQNGNGIPASLLTYVTLSIADVGTGQVINNVSQVSVLNVGRGTVDSFGNLTITLEVADTSMGEVPMSTEVQRALVVDFSAAGLVGRLQINFQLVQLVAP